MKKLKNEMNTQKNILNKTKNEKLKRMKYNKINIRKNNLKHEN